MKSNLNNNFIFQNPEVFRVLAETSPTAILIYQKDEMLYVNKAAVELSGYSAKELLSMNFWDLIHPDEREKVKSIGTARLQNENVPSRYELRIISRSNEIKWIDFSAGVIIFENKTAAIGLATDITQKIHAEHELNERNKELAWQMEEYKALNDEFLAINEELKDANETQVIINKELKDSQEKYLALFNNSHDGYFIMTDIVHDCNFKACEIFGYTKEELEGIHPANLSPPFQPDGRKSEDIANEKIAAALNNIPQHFYWKHKRKNGELFDAEINLKTIQLNDQTFIIASIRDITLKLASDHKIKDNERKLSEVYQIAKIGSWLLNVAKKEITLSKEHQLIMGLDNLSSKPLVMTISEYAARFIHPDDIPFILRQFQIATDDDIANFPNEPFGYRLLHSSGELRYMSVHAKLFEKGVIFGVTQDITESKQTEEQLLATDILLKGINNSANILLTENNFITGIRKSFEIVGKTTNISRICIYENVITDDGNMLLFQKFERTKDAFISNNPKYQNLSCRTLNIERWAALLSSDDIVKGAIKDFPFKEQMFLEDIGALAVMMIPLFIENRYWGFISFEDQLRNRVWTSAEEKILTNFANSIGGAIAKQLRNEEILKSKERAMESDRLKTAFLANMSHEIRTPMNAILGFTELLKDQNLPAFKREEFIEIISKRGKDLLNIINDIIDISKIEAGQIKINSVPCSINTLLVELYNFFESDIAFKEKTDLVLRIKSSLSNPDSIIYIDDFRLKQVFTNLLGNALKFTEHGYIEFGYQQEGNVLKFYVEDTGIGISKEKQTIIFDRFRQADDSTTKNYGGTGLGLAISKSLVELMGGYMTLESEIGSGSKFCFYLPFVQVKKKPASEAQPSENNDDTKNWDSYKILIVEDDNINYQYLKVLLRKTNAQILRVENGRDAVDLCKTDDSINVVLMDMQMPIMNGFEATKLIKEFKPQLPIIAQTAYAMAEDREKCKEAGCNDYLTKPIDIKMLSTILSKYLNN